MLPCPFNICRPRAFQQVGQHRQRQFLVVMQLDVAQVVAGIGAADLAEVDDTGVAALVLVDVGRVKVAVRQTGLSVTLRIEQGIGSFESLSNCRDAGLFQRRAL